MDTLLSSMTSISSKNFPEIIASADRLRVKEAAVLAHVSLGTIYVWIHENRFRTWIVTRRGFQRGLRFIDRASFEDFLRSQRSDN
jgi:excisionase family DNA binding protein